MTEFRDYDLDSAPDDSGEVLESAKQAYGMLPNLYRKMAESQPVARTAIPDGEFSWTFPRILFGGVVGRHGLLLGGYTFQLAAGYRFRRAPTAYPRSSAKRGSTST